MHVINMYQAKTQLSKLVADAVAGKEVIIGKAGKPMVKIVPMIKDKPMRKPGALKGKIWMAKDFDSYIPEEFLPYIE
jgi:prevent-host-death family protein